MNEELLQAVLRQAPDRSLVGLETDVWAGVSARSEARRKGVLLAGGQLGLMALALAGSLTMGSAAVAAREREHNTFAFLSSADLAPSALLIGR